jgi:hypothetical protein
MGRSVGLSDDELDLMPGGNQRSQRWHGELGRAGEDDLQESA